MTRNTIASCVALVALVGASAALSQPEPSGQPGRRPAGPGQNPEAFAQRLLQRDANEDGKLSRDELPGQFAQRIFAEFDADGDDLLSKDELMAFARAAAERRLAQPGGRGGQAAQGGARPPMDFHRAMETAGRGLRGLTRARFDGTGTQRELMAVQMVQLGIVSAKMGLANAPKTEAAKAKYPNDEDYRRAMRTRMLEILDLSIDLERAIMEGDGDRARDLVEQIERVEHDAHDLFQPEDDHDDDAPLQRPARRPARPGGAAAGGG